MKLGGECCIRNHVQSLFGGMRWRGVFSFEVRGGGLGKRFERMNVDKLAPIAIFAYNRLRHLEKTAESLKANCLAGQSELLIYSDGPKNQEDEMRVQEVRDYLKTLSGFKMITIVERERHLGLANSIIAGVTSTIGNYGKVIVVEDDLVSSKSFLSYMNEALECYKDQKKVFSITGYNYPLKIPQHYKHGVYLFYRCSSWGWATWVDRWIKVDWGVSDFSKFLRDKARQKLFNRGGEDLTPMLISQMSGGIDSWAIRWCYAHYSNNAYCLYPTISMIQNIGLDASGTHCAGSTDKFRVKIDNGEICDITFPQDLEIDEDIIQELRKMFRISIGKRILEKLKRLINKIVRNG
jgi:hypothetical protein